MTSLPPPSPQPGQRASPYRWLIIVLGLFIVMLLLYRSIDDSSPGKIELRKISSVPPFALTERSGKTITNHDLSGKIWVASFIYTTCPGPCPIITAGMAKVQDAVANEPNVQLVSFTVDPETDTPAVLAKYADSYHADVNRWWFLTGSEKQMYDLILNGFHIAVEDNTGKPPQDGQYKVTHSTYLVLIDGDGTVRGFYDGTGDDGRAGLLRDIQVLEKETGK